MKTDIFHRSVWAALANILNKTRSRYHFNQFTHVIKSCQFISFAVFDITEINEQRMCIKLTLEQKDLTICQDLQNHSTNDNFIKKHYLG